MENQTLLAIRFVEGTAREEAFFILNFEKTEEKKNWLSEHHTKKQNAAIFQFLLTLGKLEKTPKAEKQLTSLIKKAQEQFNYFHPEEFTPERANYLKGWEYDYFLSHKDKNPDAK